LPRINIRLKDALYEPLAARAKSARISFPEYVCEILHRFERNDARGYHDRSDEVQATLVQVFAILTGSIRTEGLTSSRRALTMLALCVTKGFCARPTMVR